MLLWTILQNLLGQTTVFMYVIRVIKYKILIVLSNYIRNNQTPWTPTNI